MASGFVQYYAGDRVEVESAGVAPAEQVNPIMEQVMAEKGIDMAYRRPKSIEDTVRQWAPDVVIFTGREEAGLHLPEVAKREWLVPDPAGKPVDFVRRIRDEVEMQAKRFVEK
jgi:protein-tyrosine-phosphatase